MRNREHDDANRRHEQHASKTASQHAEKIESAPARHLGANSFSGGNDSGIAIIGQRERLPEKIEH
jgi:hypothetical protein